MPVGLICYSKRFGLHERGAKAGSCFPEDFRKDLGNLGRVCPKLVSEWLGPGSLPPSLHNLQADVSSKESGIGRVVT
jgi:hypothetical protein